MVDMDARRDEKVCQKVHQHDECKAITCGCELLITMELVSCNSDGKFDQNRASQRSRLSITKRSQAVPYMDLQSVSTQDNDFTTVPNPNLLLAGLLVKSSSSTYRVSNTTGDNELHRAVLLSQLNVVQSLLEAHKDEYLYNSRNEKGCTPVHYAAISGHTNILKTILGQERVLVNAKNWDGATPLHLAVVNKNKEAAAILVEHWGSPSEELRTEEAMKKHMPELLNKLDMNIQCDIGTLFRAIYCERQDLFEQLISDCGQSELNESDGQYTLLEASCLLGLDSCVDELLRQYLLHFSDDLHVPILLAASWGYFKVLPKFKGLMGQFNSGNGENVLHILTKGLNNKEKDKRSFFTQVNLNKEKQDYDRCIVDLLNSELDADTLGINSLDQDDITPLYYSITSKAEETTLALLSKGASLWTLDKSGNPLIDYLSGETLEKYFDSCVTETRKSHGVTVQARINYKFMSNISEFEILEYLSKSKKRWFLLTHPVIQTLHSFKRKVTFSYFALNTLLYVLFVCMWTTFVLTDYQERSGAQGGWGVTSVILWCIICIREFLYMLNDPRSYFKNWDNLTRIFVLVACGLVFFTRLSHFHIRQFITLVTWLEVAFVAGGYPFSIYGPMFVAVAKSYLMAFFIFVSFIVGFVSSFYINICIGHKHPYCKNMANATLVLKSAMTLMLGQRDLDDISFSTEYRYVVNVVMYFIFLFLIVLVFMNFLNALAVSDIQALMDKADLYYRRSFIEILCHLDSIFWPRTFSKRLDAMSKLPKMFKWDVTKSTKLFEFLQNWEYMKRETRVLRGEVMVVDLSNGSVLFDNVTDVKWRLAVKYLDSIRRCLERQRRKAELGS